MKIPLVPYRLYIEAFKWRMSLLIRISIAILSFLLPMGCLPPALGILELEPQTTSATVGVPGPYHAASVTLPVQTRISDSRTLTTLFPATADGSPDLSGAPYPAVVFIHGGAVVPTRYQWVGEHFASRGYVVLMPNHLIQAAIVEADNTKIMLEQARHWVREERGVFQGLFDPDASLAIMGHSLGSVTSATLWAKYADDFDRLGMIAGRATATTDVSRTGDVQVLFLSGSEDGLIAPQDSRTSFDEFASTKWFAVVDGMNHYAWCDNPTERELANDNPRTRSDAETRIDALRVLDAWLDSTSYPDRAPPWPTGPFPGVEVDA